MIYSPASIANAFLSRSFENKAEITPMKIQKLIYIAHGYSLAVRDEPLIDELFEAWKFGPVLESLYQECKKYGYSAITNYLHDYGNTAIDKTPAPIPNDIEVNNIIDFVWKTYGCVHPKELSNWTHEKDGPWDKVINSNNGIIYRNEGIDNNIIKEYFKKMIPNDSES